MQPKHLTLFLLALGAAPALAHLGDRGVDYTLYRDRAGTPCCDDRDCRPADDFADVPSSGMR